MNESLMVIAERLLNENPNMCLGGSLMLKYRGIDLGRDPHDIDLVMIDPKTYKQNDLKIPAGMDIKYSKKASDGYSSEAYSYNGITIDILVCKETPEIINGLPCGTVDKLMKAKYKYTQSELTSANSKQKHYDDLVKLGFTFPVQPVISQTSSPFLWF